MRAKDFKKGIYNIRVEYCCSTMEVKTLTESRPAPSDYAHQDYDFFGSPLRRIDKKFFGFNDSKELMEQVIGGSPDIKLLKKVRAFTQEAHGQADPDVIVERKYGFYGNHFDVDRYNFGNKFYMYRERKTKREEPKFLNLVIEMGIHCKIKAKELSEAGAYLAQLLVSLEQDDFNFSVTAIHGHFALGIGDVLMTDVKSIDEPINYKRVMFMMSPAYYRGLGWGWFAREALVNPNNNGKTDISITYPMYRQLCSDDVIDMASEMMAVDKEEVKLLRIGDLLDVIERSKYAPNPDAYVKDWLVKAVTGE